MTDAADTPVSSSSPSADRQPPVVSLRSLRRVGAGFVRPECVVTGSSGTVWVSDRRAALCRISSDGRCDLLGRPGGTPNGFAIDRDGGAIVCDIELGTVYRLGPDGRHLGVLADGLGAPNFVCFDESFELWLTVSTAVAPRTDALAHGVTDGYVATLPDDRIRIVADGLGYPNEIRFDSAGAFAYVVESGRARIRRFPIRPDGSLGQGESFGPDPLFPGAFPDGIAFDSRGHLWVTELSRNALLVIAPDGTLHFAVEDLDAAVLRSPTCIAFGGKDLRTAFVGSLELDHLLAFRSPWPGAPLPHWSFA